MTSSPPSSRLSLAVSSEFPSYCWLLRIRVALVADLTQHLTTRADDNHAPPVYDARREGTVKFRSSRCQDLVRFFARFASFAPHAPPAKTPSIPLSFILANVPPRWNTYCVCGAPMGFGPPTPSSSSFTAWTTRASNPVCSHAFEPERQLPSSKPPSPLVLFLNIHAFHRYTRNSACLSSTLALQFPKQSRVEPWLSLQTCSAVCALYTQ